MLFALLLAAATASPQRSLAVLEFHSKLPPQDVDVAYITDTVRTAAKDSLRSLKVMTRENLLVLLAASGKKMEDCEGECEVETGRRVGSDLVVTGEVLKFGTQFKVAMKMHDTRSGELISGAQATGKDLDELDLRLGAAVAKLLAPLSEPAAQQPARPPISLQSGAQQPGLQQPGAPEPGAPPQRSATTSPQATQSPATPPQPPAQKVAQPEPRAQRDAGPASPAGFSARLAGGLHGVLGYYELSSDSTVSGVKQSNSSSSYSYGAGAFFGLHFVKEWELSAFADYDVLSRDAADLNSVSVGGQVRYHGGGGTALLVGLGYAATDDSSGPGVAVLLGADLPFGEGPLALRVDGSWRSFKGKGSAAGSTELSGSILLLRVGLGLVF